MAINLHPTTRYQNMYIIDKKKSFLQDDKRINNLKKKTDIK